jgi:glycosyltransferase involved in cell wall biosynthesis
VVGASGTIEWRKGADLFILLAQRLVSLHPEKNIKLCWLGKPADDAYFEQLNHDIQKAGLMNIVEFLPTTPDPLSVYKNFNVFVLTAREEPFGLAAAECAAMGIPVIMFDKAGGFISFVENGAALAVPYMDIDAMADMIFKVLSNDELLHTLRLNANSYIEKSHDGNRNYAAMLELIERISEQFAFRN